MEPFISRDVWDNVIVPYLVDTTKINFLRRKCVEEMNVTFIMPRFWEEEYCPAGLTHSISRLTLSLLREARRSNDGMIHLERLNFLCGT